MNKDAIFSNSGKTPSSATTAATKLHISPMSPLNIQTLKNSINERTDLSSCNSYRNGNVLLQQNHNTLPNNSFHNDAAQLTPSYIPTSSTPVVYPSNEILGGGGTSNNSSNGVDNMFLHRIIAKDVNHPRTTLLAEKSVDSRKTVVKKAPGGTVQITYKNMINVSPTSTHNNQPINNPVYILPKPMNGVRHHQQQQPINHSQVMTFPHSTPTTAHSNNTTNYLTNKSPTEVKKSLNELNSSPPISSSWMSCNATQFNSGNSDIDMTVVGTQQSNVICTSSESYTGQLGPANITSHDDIDDHMNPFNGIDIDLSCLATEPFDALQLQQFYQNCDGDDGSGGVTSSEVMVSAPPPTVNNIPPSHHQTPIVDSNNICLTGGCGGGDGMPIILGDVASHSASYYGKAPPSATTIDSNRVIELINIIDVSPEIAVCVGGIKIILIGSWNAKNSRYQCQFGSCLVDAELVQNGVLRCYSPKHKPGVVKLTVLCNGRVVSKDAKFSFVDGSEKTSSLSSETDHDVWLSITNESLIHLLVERTSFISFMLTGEELKTPKSIDLEETDESQIEDKLIEICKSLIPLKADIEFDYNTEGMMTVLHLSSALGYIKLTQLLMNWVESSPNPIILAEACPTCMDQYSLIPIMWSSAKGHFNTTCVLHQWAETTIDLKDACSCTALSLATQNGHASLVEYLGRLMKKSTVSRENSMNQETFACSSQQGKLPSLSSTPPSYANPNSVVSYVSNISKDDDFSPRTLGKTLALIQSMLNDPDGDEKHEEENDDEEASIFTTPTEFVHTRQRSIADESIAAPNQMSPASPAQSALHSPFNRQMRETAEFYEFFYKAKKIEKDFAELTLTDQEQEELYRAANVIQTAYKDYKERRKQRDQEFCSATLIQSYYRRYKKYAAFKKMQKGAVLIQNQYRAHRAKKKSEAASLIQTYYRRYRQRKHRDGEQRTSIQEKNKLEQQAGRKVNRYLKQTTHRFSREFADDFNTAAFSSTTEAMDCRSFLNS